MSSKWTDRLSMRTGVPVFMRADRMPRRVMLSVKCSTAGSATRPPATFLRPMCMRPLRKVPAVTTTQRAWMVMPQMVRTPLTCPCSVSSSSTWSW